LNYETRKFTAGAYCVDLLADLMLVTAGMRGAAILVTVEFAPVWVLPGTQIIISSDEIVKKSGRL
jgi:hypothetical protein